MVAARLGESDAGLINTEGDSMLNSTGGFPNDRLPTNTRVLDNIHVFLGIPEQNIQGPLLYVPS